jgi:hypothetical protein
VKKLRGSPGESWMRALIGERMTSYLQKTDIHLFEETATVLLTLNGSD